MQQKIEKKWKANRTTPELSYFVQNEVEMFQLLDHATKDREKVKGKQNSSRAILYKMKYKCSNYWMQGTKFW